MKTSVQRGDILDLTASVAYLSGEIVVEGEWVGVALKNAKDGKIVTAVEEVYDLPSTGAISEGVKVYVDAAQGVASTASGGSYAGISTGPAVDGFVPVKLKGAGA